MDEQKLDNLRKILRSMKSVLVAYSGGVDSSFLIKLASDELGKKAVAATAVSEVYIEDDYKRAKRLVKELRIKHLVFRLNLLKIKGFAANPEDRCYLCKKKMLGELNKIARLEKIDWIIDGTNSDDEIEFRPGRQAAKELGVRSPLAEAGFKKEEIRYFSRRIGLFTWDQPTSTCLATRLSYGEKITLDKLKMIEQGERFIKRLGVKDLRLRWRKGEIARIELTEDDRKKLTAPALKQEVVTGLKRIGYQDVTFGLRRDV